MALSEKTIELNLSRVVIEKCRRHHQIQAFAIGFTQAQEATLGVDVSLEAPGWKGGFIQYKAMHPKSGGVMRWNLNRTKNRDQHSLLLALEAKGFPVFYCFPLFADWKTLSLWSPPALWSKVAWVRPKDIPVPAPVDDHHHVELDGHAWTVHSDEATPIPGNRFVDFDTVQKSFRKQPLRGVVGLLKELLEPGAKSSEVEDDSAYERAADVTQGLNLVAIAPAEG